ncbi:hypothetical protein H9P43_003769 [Blastocladiella emersonii ATCC 22665]|nr:hypothetical protein H9P43_003769 [Blastocladiella emersonii ATCC 22665]
MSASSSASRARSRSPSPSRQKKATLSPEAIKDWDVDLHDDTVYMAQTLIARLTRGLYLAGAPLYTVEIRATAVADAIGIPLTVMALPNGLILAFGRADNPQAMWPTTVAISGLPGQNMARLYDLDRFAQALAGAVYDPSLMKPIRKRLLQSLGVEDEEAEAKAGLIAAKTADKYRSVGTEDDEEIEAANDNGGSPTDWEMVEGPDTLADEEGPAPPLRAGPASASNPNLAPVQTLALPKAHLKAFNDELNALLTSKDVLPPWVRIVCQGITGMLLATLWLPLTVEDMVVTWAIGALHGYLLILEDRHQIMSMDVIIPLVVGFVGRVLEMLLPADRLCFSTVTVMASFTYFPGVPITLALVELAAHNVVSGVVRLLGAFFRTFQLGFGMVMGAEIASAIGTGLAVIGNTKCMSTARPGAFVVRATPEFIPLVTIPLMLSSCVVLRAHFHQWPWMVLTSVIGLIVYLLALQVIETGMAATLSALAVSCASHFFARRWNHTGIATLLNGIIWLNPGPPMVRGAMLLLAGGDLEASVLFASEATIRALSITAGLFVSRMFMLPVLKRRRVADLSV